MNKQDWLKEAIDYIDSLDTEEFEDFLVSCVPYNLVSSDYNDLQHGRVILLSSAANMDEFYTDNISLAA